MVAAVDLRSASHCTVYAENSTSAIQPNRCFRSSLETAIAILVPGGFGAPSVAWACPPTRILAVHHGIPKVLPDVPWPSAGFLLWNAAHVSLAEPCCTATRASGLSDSPVPPKLYTFALFNRRALAQRRFVAATIRARPSGDRTRRGRGGRVLIATRRDPSPARSYRPAARTAAATAFHDSRTCRWLQPGGATEPTRRNGRGSRRIRSCALPPTATTTAFGTTASSRAR